jgi:hypothetical protein
MPDPQAPTRCADRHKVSHALSVRETGFEAAKVVAAVAM